jgi:hypothetical protein
VCIPCTARRRPELPLPFCVVTLRVCLLLSSANQFRPTSMPPKPPKNPPSFNRDSTTLSNASSRPLAYYLSLLIEDCVCRVHLHLLSAPPCHHPREDCPSKQHLRPIMDQCVTNEPSSGLLTGLDPQPTRRCLCATSTRLPDGFKLST